MKKIAMFGISALLLIGMGLVFSRAQVRPNQLTTAKTSQVQEIDLLKRIQVLEKELAELKKVIEINGPSVRIKAQGSLDVVSQGSLSLKSSGLIKIQSPQLDLMSSDTRATNMRGTISLVLGPIQGTSPAGPAFITLPTSIPFVIKQ